MTGMAGKMQVFFIGDLGGEDPAAVASYDGRAATGARAGAGRVSRR